MMEIPKDSELEKVKLFSIPRKIPTIESEFSYGVMILEMKDGTIAEYVFDPICSLYGKYKNKKDFVDKNFVATIHTDFKKEFSSLFTLDNTYLTDIKKKYPNVDNVYIGDL